MSSSLFWGWDLVQLIGKQYPMCSDSVCGIWNLESLWNIGGIWNLTRDFWVVSDPSNAHWSANPLPMCVVLCIHYFSSTSQLLTFTWHGLYQSLYLCGATLGMTNHCLHSHLRLLHHSYTQADIFSFSKSFTQKISIPDWASDLEAAAFLIVKYTAFFQTWHL